MTQVILPAVKKLDLADPAAAAFAHALAEPIIRYHSCDRQVAEAALRTGDRPTFERALSNLPKYQANLAGNRAMQILQAGEHALAFAMLEQISRSPSAPQSVYNNALYVLFAVKSAGDLPPDRLESLLNKSWEVGRANPPIFHNLACVLVMLGRYDQALQAVREAVRWGYHKLDQLRKDGDLDPIRGDPRFEAAFALPHEPLALEQLVVKSAVKGEPLVLVAPVFMWSLFFERRDMDVGSIADLLAMIADDLPKEVLKHYQWRSSSSSFSPIKKGKIARDLTALRKLAADESSFVLCWAEHPGEPIGHRVTLHIDEDEGELTVAWPLAVTDEPESLSARLCRYASLVKYAAGIAGNALSVYEAGHGLANDAEDILKKMRPRYLGLTAGQAEAHVHLWDPGFAPIPSWLTFLGPKLVEQLGGAAALAQSAAPASLGIVGHGICLRSAHAPFVGLATFPGDLAALPAVAQALKTVRVANQNAIEQLDAIARVPVPADVEVGPVPGPEPVVTATKSPAKKPTRKKSAQKSSK